MSLTSVPACHLHTLLIFLYTVAVRLGEAQRIQWEQVDLHGRTMQLWDTKTGEPRTVPLVPELVDSLSRVPAAKRQGAVFYRGQFRKTWAKACKKCGLSGLLVHDFRRSAIRNMTLAGVPQNVIMAISGHKTISTFLRYNIVAPNNCTLRWKPCRCGSKTATMQVEGLSEPKLLKAGVVQR